MNIVVDNYMMTKEEASKRNCSYLIDKFGFPRKCSTDKCMSWIEARKRIEREDHSGARDVIQNEARARGFQEVKRDGPSGSLGYLYLEAQGFCLRLWRNLYEKDL